MPCRPEQAFQILTEDGWAFAMEHTYSDFGRQSILFFVPVTLVGRFLVTFTFISIVLSQFANQTPLRVEMANMQTDCLNESHLVMDSRRKRARPTSPRSRSPTPPAHCRSDALAAMLRLSRARRGQLALQLEERLRARMELDQSGDERGMAQLADVALCLRPRHPLRIALWRVVGAPAFESFAFGVVLLNCASLSYTFGAGSDEARAVESFDLACLLFFTLEMALKIVTYGLARGRNTYLQNGWNVLDAIIVAVGWCILIAPHVAACTRRQGAGGTLRIVVAASPASASPLACALGPFGCGPPHPPTHAPTHAPLCVVAALLR